MLGLATLTMFNFPASLSRIAPRLGFRLPRLAAACLAFCTATALATTIRVPQDKPTIQAGIDAAANGDTVLVSPGTYYENIDFKGKAITVTSSDGASKTIIDGNYAGPVVTFVTSETRSSVLNGFTIQHGGGGSIYRYAGLVINLSAPTITANIITTNRCFGVSTYQASPILSGNEITQTQDPNGGCAFAGGAGIYLIGDASLLSNFRNLHAEVIGNNVHDNRDSSHEDAGGNGGAIAVWGGSPLIQGNRIHHNKTWGGTGGGINVVSADAVTIVNNLIYQNEAGCGGGGLAFHFGSKSGYSAVTDFVANNTIVNNTYGAACGFTDNGSGSQIYVWYGYSGRLFVNNIIVGNSTYPAIVDDTGYDSLDGKTTLFDHNLIWNPSGKLVGGYLVDPTGSYGNISADPQLKNVAAEDFTLSAGSPAIDAGNNSSVQFLAAIVDADTTHDFYQSTRLQDATGAGYPKIDIGAAEFTGATANNATTILLTPSQYLVNGGTDIVLTVVLKSPLGVPAGSLHFFQDNIELGVSTITGGTATWNLSKILPGLHKYLAVYDGQAPFLPASSPVTEVYAYKYPVTLTFTSSKNPSFFGENVTFSVHVSSPDGTIPSPIQVTEGSTTLATLLPDASGNATYQTSSLALGVHSIYATYAGDVLHASGSAYIYQQVLDPKVTTTTLTSTPNPVIANNPVTFTATITPVTGTPTGTVAFLDGTTNLGSGTVNAGKATLTTSLSTVGYHTISATYSGDSDHNPSTGTLSQQVIAGYPTALSLVSSPNPSNLGQPVTFTMTVSAQTGTPAGTPAPQGKVQFTDTTTNTDLGTVTLVSGVAVSAPVSTLAVGAHHITATYMPDSTYTGGTISITHTVKGYDTTVTLAATPNPAMAQQAITLIAHAAPAATHGVPTGTITIYQTVGSTSTAQGSYPLNASGDATVTLHLAAGNYVYFAQYNGDSTYNSGARSTPITIAVNAYASQATLSDPSPIYAYQQKPLIAHIASADSPTQPNSGTVAFKIGANTISAALDASGNAQTSIALPGGTYTATATFAANDTFDTSSATTVFTVLPDNTVTTLTATPTQGSQRQTFQVSIVSTATHSPTAAIGQVTLFDGGNSIATGALDGNGRAVFNLNNLAVGTHILTATYASTGAAAQSFLTSTSAPVSITVTPSDFVLVAPPTLEVLAEHHLFFAVSLSSIGDFAGTVAISCEDLPEHAYCYYDYGKTVSLTAGGTGILKMVFETSDVRFYANNTFGPAAGGIALAALPALFFLRRRRRFASLLAALLITIAAFSATGCSGKLPAYTQPGTYTIHIKGVSGNITHTAAVQLIVKPEH